MFVYVLMGIEFSMVFMLRAIGLLQQLLIFMLLLFLMLLMLLMFLMLLMLLLLPLGKFTTELNETYSPSLRMEVRWSM